MTRFNNRNTVLINGVISTSDFGEFYAPNYLVSKNTYKNISIKFSVTTTDNTFSIGLMSSSVPANFIDLTHSIRFYNFGSFTSVDGGDNPYYSSDVFEITLKDGTVYFYQNGILKSSVTGVGVALRVGIVTGDSSSNIIHKVEIKLNQEIEITGLTNGQEYGIRVFPRNPKGQHQTRNDRGTALATPQA